MRHRNAKHILSRPRDHRKALVRNLLTSLFLHGKVKTTQAKARALSQAAEKLIARVRAQKEDFNAIRTLKQFLYTEEASKKALQYAKALKRNSGFVRIVKLGVRPGDSALMVQVDLLEDAS